MLSGAAVVAPFAMVPSGADHQLRLVAQDDLGGRHDLERVSLVAPYATGGLVLLGYGASAAFSACGAMRVQAGVLQALVFSVTSTHLLKWAVGRQWPNGGADPDAPDRLEHPERAREFSPFAIRHSAWPSGHTNAMFAAAAALRASAAELGVARWSGYPLAVGVAAGMWLGDHHWASDIVSGALFGEAIGDSVGTAFAADANADSRANAATLVVAPLGENGVFFAYARTL